MAGNNFDEVIAHFRITQDSSKLLKLLINIRKEVDWPKNRDNINKVREKEILKDIVVCLQNSKKAIIDVSLSILGNCCLDSKCSRDLISKCNVLPGLNQVLKKYPKEDSINGRVFRIVGNLCQHKDQWGSEIVLKKPQIIIHTISFLKEVAAAGDDNIICEGTIIMAIRLLREILSKTTIDELMTGYGVLKVVGMLLIKYATIWEETKRSKNVLISIIKLLQEYSKYRNYTIIIQMKNTEMGDSLAFLSQIIMVAPRQVIQIIMNFLQISLLNSELPIPKIFDSIIEVLKDVKEYNATCEECISCICKLLDHPANRNNEHCGDSIPVLINILASLPLDSCDKILGCNAILCALAQCRFNESLILDQIKNNIIQVLREKINLIVGANEPLTIYHKCVKKRISNDSFSKSSFKRSRLGDYKEEENSPSASTDNKRFYSTRINHNMSPSSSCESEPAMSWTSGLSPQSSPSSQLFGFEESDSDDYSPVCSEADPTDFYEDQSPNNLEADKYSDFNFEDEESLHSSNGDFKSLKDAKERLLMDIVELLRGYSKLRPAIPQLGEPELLLSLTKSCLYFDYPNFDIWEILDVIHRILDCHEYLLPLMQTHFIPAIYDLLQLQHGPLCLRCKHFKSLSMSILRKMSELAESGAGKGDIAHKLLRGDTTIKEQLVFVIPYIIKNKSILAKLLLNCGGLEILMKLLREEDSQLHEKSIKVLCVLASHLCIPNPKNVKNTYKISMSEQESGILDNVVTFRFDDGSLIQADRDLLSQNSDFFSRMLNGDFKESSEDEIALHNVNNVSFKCLLHLIRCGIDKSAAVKIDLDLDAHLDVIALCDRFLMTDFCVYLTDCVEKYRFSSDTIPTIYQWSMESKTNLLRVECIAFALVAKIADPRRFQMFKNLFDVGYNDELLEDIRKLLVRYLTVHHNQNQVLEAKNAKKKRRAKRLHQFFS